MPLDAHTRRPAARINARRQITIGRYHDRDGDHVVALTRDLEAGGPWRLTDTAIVTVFAPEETQAEAVAAAELYLREHDPTR